MNRKKFYLLLLIPVVSLTGCDTLGMLFFYRDSRTASVYRSNTSVKNYYTIKATTLYHCGCTHLYVENYKRGKREFILRYEYPGVTKSIDTYNKETGKKETINLLATTENNFTVPFDSLDIEIFKRIDTLAIQKPKGIGYAIQRKDYKGFIKNPY